MHIIVGLFWLFFIITVTGVKRGLLLGYQRDSVWVVESEGG